MDRKQEVTKFYAKACMEVGNAYPPPLVGASDVCLVGENPTCSVPAL